MPILMSIRKVHADRIFEGFKRIEFRKFFPNGYRGTVIVYECGPGSCHKVVGKFRTENATMYEPSKGVTADVRRCVESTEYTDFDVDCMMQLSEPRVLIPVIDPVRIPQETLEEFSAKYVTESDPARMSPVWTRSV